MRRPILGILAILATMNVAHARKCSGQGSPRVLILEHWTLVPDGNGVVQLTYRLHEPKPVTRLGGHVYFDIDGAGVLADAALELFDPAGLPPDGTATAKVTKPMARQLASAVPASVTATVCTNYIEYLDGSGIIID